MKEEKEAIVFLGVVLGIIFVTISGLYYSHVFAENVIKEHYQNGGKIKCKVNGLFSDEFVFTKKDKDFTIDGEYVYNGSLEIDLSQNCERTMRD